MGVVRLAFEIFFYSLVAILFLMTVPGIPPHFKFEYSMVRPPRKLEGKLTPNDVLDKAELVVDGEFIGPESIAIRNDEAFTGVQGGQIIKISPNGKWKKIFQLGDPTCVFNWKSSCYRPLGMRFNRQGKLLVADARYGIFEVDVDKGTAEHIVKKSMKPINGEPISFADDLDEDKEGNIYFSDASQHATLESPYNELLGDPSGRLLKFDPKTKKIEVLHTGIQFANGVQLSRKEDFVAICETAGLRVLKYYIKGPKKGKTEVLIAGLPGIPDNIRSNGKGGFYISLIVSDTEQKPILIRTLKPYPLFRKLTLRIQNLLLKFVEILDQFAYADWLTGFYQYVAVLGPIGTPTTVPKGVIIVDIDEDGTIVGSLQSNKSVMRLISEISLGEKYTYFGTPYEPQLWRIKTEYLV